MVVVETVESEDSGDGNAGSNAGEETRLTELAVKGQSHAKGLTTGSKTIKEKEETKQQEGREAVGEKRGRTAEIVTTTHAKVRLVSPIKKAKNPYARRNTSSTVTCGQCNKEYPLKMANLYYQCPNKECGCSVKDYMRDDLWNMDPIFSTVPKNSAEQDATFDDASKLFTIFRTKIEGPESLKKIGQNMDLFEEVFGLKSVCIAGGILPEDRFKAELKDHAGMQDAVSNCILALERKDKVGWKNAFSSMLYFMFLGYYEQAKNNQMSLNRRRATQKPVQFNASST